MSNYYPYKQPHTAYLQFCGKWLFKDKADSRIRTDNLSLTKRLLYHWAMRAYWPPNFHRPESMLFMPATLHSHENHFIFHQNSSVLSHTQWLTVHRNGRIRTPDLSQTSECSSLRASLRHRLSRSAFLQKCTVEFHVFDRLWFAHNMEAI